MAKKVKKAAKKPGAKKPAKEATKKEISVKKVAKKQSTKGGALKKTSRAMVKRSKPKATVNEPNKGFVSHAVEATKDATAPLMPNKETGRPTE